MQSAQGALTPKFRSLVKETSCIQDAGSDGAVGLRSLKGEGKSKCSPDELYSGKGLASSPHTVFHDGSDGANSDDNGGYGGSSICGGGGGVGCGDGDTSGVEIGGQVTCLTSSSKSGKASRPLSALRPPRLIPPSSVPKVSQPLQPVLALPPGVPLPPPPPPPATATSLQTASMPHVSTSLAGQGLGESSSSGALISRPSQESGPQPPPLATGSLLTNDPHPAGQTGPIALPPSLGLSPDIVEQLRNRMCQVEGTSGSVCHYGNSCRVLDCPNQHPAGREIEINPELLVCRFGRKCKRSACFYVHPQGRELDDDPTKGTCRLGQACTRPNCMFDHPEGREPILQLRCFSCSQFGHIQKDCPQGKDDKKCRLCMGVGHLQRECPEAKARARSKGTYVMMSKFPQEWLSGGKEKIIAQLVEELEVFGELLAVPEHVDGDDHVYAAFADLELAKQAVQALNGAMFEIEMCPDPPAALMTAPLPLALESSHGGTLFMKGFPHRWGMNEITDFLKGAVRAKAPLLGVDLITPKDESMGGHARLRYSDSVSAKRVWEELQGQKIAGKPLSISIEGLGEAKAKSDNGCSVVSKRERSRSRDNVQPKKDNVQPKKDNVQPKKGEGDSMSGQNQKDKQQLIVVHIDELTMPQRPDVQPTNEDREVFVDPLPPQEELEEWLAQYGASEDVFRIPDLMTGLPGDRGYVRFKDNAAAQKCVEGGAAQWSESERTLSSQDSHHGGRQSAYPDSLVARLLGPRGETINSIKSEICASVLHLRGAGLGEIDKMTSQRVHFVCKGLPETIQKLQPALERILSNAHQGIRSKLAEVQSGVQKKQSDSVDENAPKRRRRTQRNTSRNVRPQAAAEPVIGEQFGMPPAETPKHPPPRPDHMWHPHGPPPGWPGGPPMWAPPAVGHWPHAPPAPWSHPSWYRPRHEHGWYSSRDGSWVAVGPPGPDSMHSRPPGHHWTSASAQPRQRDGSPSQDVPPGHWLQPPAAWTSTQPASTERSERQLPPPVAEQGQHMQTHGHSSPVDSGPKHGEEHRRRRHGGRRRRREKDPEADVVHDESKEQRSSQQQQQQQQRPHVDHHTERHNDTDKHSCRQGASDQVVPKEGLKPTLADISEISNPDDFFKTLPTKLTLPEEELASAVFSFLRSWSDDTRDSKDPNLGDLGSDPRVRACKAAALPREVALKSWMQRRLTDEVALARGARGQTTVGLIDGGNIRSYSKKQSSG